MHARQIKQVCKAVAGRGKNVMKRVRIGGAVLLIAVLLAGLLPASGVEVHARYDNQYLTLTNSGFEEPETSDIPGWSVTHGGGSAAATTEQAFRGEKSLKLTDASPVSAAGMESDKLPALTGMTYTAEANALTNDNVAQLYIRFWNDSNVLLGSSHSVVVPAGQWENAQARSVAPLGTSYVSVLLYTSAAATGTVYFDEIKLSVERDMLISNSSFELSDGTAPTDWQRIHGGGTISVSTDRAYTGSQSLKLADNRTDYALSAQSAQIAASPGETYVVQAMVYVDTGGAQLFMRYWDSEMNLIGQSPYTVAGPSTGSWKSISSTGVAPANTRYVSAMLFSPMATTGTVYFDDVMLSTRVTNLGVQMTSTVVHGAVFGFDENNKPVLYAVTDGNGAEPPRLAVIDYNANRIDRLIDIDAASGGTSPAWAVTFSSDGKVYMGVLNMANGALYRYSPGDSFVESVGIPSTGSKLIWDLKPGPNGEIYVGSSGEGALYRYVHGSGFSVIGSSPLEPNQTYVRSVAYDPVYNAVFAGLGTKAYLKRYDLDTNQTIEVLPSPYSSNTYVYDMQYRSGKLFARLSSPGPQIVLAITEDGNGDVQVAVDAEIPEITSLGITSSVSGSVYYTYNNAVHQYDLAAKTSGPVGGWLPVNPIEMDAVELDDQVQFPGHTVVGIGTTSGTVWLVKYNLLNGATNFWRLPVPEANGGINHIETGPDGRIYTGGFLNGGIGAYTPLRSDESEQFKGIGQPEGMLTFNDKLYIGTYPGAGIYEYDPAQTWTLDTGGTNPKMLFAIGNEQDRPYAMASGEGKLFFGTVPKAGALGGALTIYDPAAGGPPDVIRNIVQDQSVVSLAYKDGIIYGGTSIWGGPGTTPVASSAVFFAYDAATGQKITEIVPVAGKKAITALLAAPDGNIWGLLEGHLFIYDPVQQQIIYNKNILPIVSYTSATYTDGKLLVGKDGNIYMKLRVGLYRINPATKAISNIAVGTNIRGLTQDRYGNLYFYWQDRLFRYAF